MTIPRRAILLDRDGTINVKAPQGEYVQRPEQVRLLPGVARAIARLNAAGVPVAVVTNQRGVALGRMTLADLEAVHRRLDALLAAEGARVDAYFACPHGLGECDCRKPAPGLLLRAAAEMGLADLSSSVMVGDSGSDVTAGRGAGARTVLLAGAAAAEADHVAASLEAAVDWILA